MRTILTPILVICIMLIGIVGAVPTTNAPTAVGNNNVTFNSAGGVGNVWFQYGTVSDNLNIWTEAKSVASTTEIGSPLTAGTKYYVQACDSTGCDATPETFTLLAIVPVPTSTLGNAVRNMTASRFNMLNMPNNLLIPYAWLFPATQQAMGLTIVFGMMFMFIYIGLWLRTRSVATGVVIGLLTSSFILFSNTGLNLGIPVEFQAIAQALLYASMAGVLLAFLKK